MFGQDREARDRGDEAYYRLPSVPWTELDVDIEADLRQLRRLVDLALAEFRPGAVAATATSGPATPGEPAPTPTQLAFRLTEMANRLWSASAGSEQDLRQVITTLRTALAICWDLYTPRQAEKTTVQEHMTDLRERIEDFERDLRDLQNERGSG